MLLKSDLSEIQFLANEPQEGYIYLDNNTEFAALIFQNYPYVQIVIENNEVTDVIILEKPVEEVPLSETQKLEIMLLSANGIEVETTLVDEVVEEIVGKYKDKLVPIPTQGADWSETANYIEGDTAVSLVDGNLYVAQRYSRNKEPSKSAFNSKGQPFWLLKEEILTYPTYEELEEGVIKVGTICTYENETYKCKKQHIKSILYLPTKRSHWTTI